MTFYIYRDKLFAVVLADRDRLDMPGETDGLNGKHVSSAKLVEAETIPGKPDFVGNPAAFNVGQRSHAVGNVLRAVARQPYCKGARNFPVDRFDGGTTDISALSAVCGRSTLSIISEAGGPPAVLTLKGISPGIMVIIMANTLAPV